MSNKEGISVPENGKRRVWCSLKCANLTFDKEARVTQEKEIQHLKQFLIGPVRAFLSLFR
jgi:hypothetical protein